MDLVVVAMVTVVAVCSFKLQRSFQIGGAEVFLSIYISFFLRSDICFFCNVGFVFTVL